MLVLYIGLLLVTIGVAYTLMKPRRVSPRKDPSTASSTEVHEEPVAEEPAQDHEEYIQSLGQALIEAIETKNIERLGDIRNEVINTSFWLRDDRLDLIKTYAGQIEVLLQNPDGLYPSVALVKNLPKAWQPSWWHEAEDAAYELKRETEVYEERRRQGQREGREDDFISTADVKPLPSTYWSDKREVLVPIVMDYVSAKGEETTREVDVVNFMEGITDDYQPDIYFDAFCHMRNARRTFLASRAKRITIIETGEVFTDHNDFRNYLSDFYSSSSEGKLDHFFGKCGAEISEIALFIGRAEGRLKNRVKKILIAKLAELAEVSVEDLKTSKVCKRVFQEVGFDSRDFKKAVKTFGEKVYEDPTLYPPLESILNDMAVDKKGVVDEVMQVMVKKTLKKVAPPPTI